MSTESIDQRIKNSFKVTDESELKQLIQDVREHRDKVITMIQFAEKYKRTETKQWLELHRDIYIQAITNLENQKREMFGEREPIHV